MNRRLTGLIFFLLICQFCAQAQNWQSVGNGLIGGQRSIVVDSLNQKIYTSGIWNSLPRFLQYDIVSNVWSPLGTSGNPGVCLKVTIYRGELYGSSNNGVYKYVAPNWQNIAPSHGAVSGFIQNDTDLYVFGSFDSIAGIPALKIARFDGTNWFNVGSIPVNNVIGCATFYQGELYVGGTIYNSTLGVYKIMKWDGSQWVALPNSSNRFTGGWDWIDCMTVFNNELYVGGYFSYSPNGNPDNNIARWNGSTWSAVGGGVNFQAVTMQVFNNELWVGGAFTNAGGIAATDIAKWNGTDWCNVGDFDNTVLSFTVYNGELYAGTGAWTVDGDSINEVVKWIGGNNTGVCGHINVGIQENQEDATVQLFPNPVIQNAVFVFPSASIPRTVIILDQVGREIWRRETEAQQLEFSAEEFAPGLYYFRVEHKAGSIYSGKFIIQ